MPEMSKLSFSPLHLLLSVVICWTILSFACTPKKVSSNYGDNKTYQDEDSNGDIKSTEKKAKMPFDTSSLPVVPKR
jgi:hypothetical protein